MKPTKRIPKHRFSFEQKCYIAKFFQHDGYLSLGALFGVKPYVVYHLYVRLEKEGKIEQYKKYWDTIHKGG